MPHKKSKMPSNRIGRYKLRRKKHNDQPKSLETKPQESTTPQKIAENTQFSPEMLIVASEKDNGLHYEVSFVPREKQLLLKAEYGEQYTANLVTQTINLAPLGTLTYVIDNGGAEALMGARVKVTSTNAQALLHAGASIKGPSATATFESSSVYWMYFKFNVIAEASAGIGAGVSVEAAGEIDAQQMKASAGAKVGWFNGFGGNSKLQVVCSIDTEYQQLYDYCYQKRVKEDPLFRGLLEKNQAGKYLAPHEWDYINYGVDEVAMEVDRNRRLGLPTDITPPQRVMDNPIDTTPKLSQTEPPRPTSAAVSVRTDKAMDTPADAPAKQETSEKQPQIKEKPSQDDSPPPLFLPKGLEHLSRPKRPTPPKQPLPEDARPPTILDSLENLAAERKSARRAQKQEEEKERFTSYIAGIPRGVEIGMQYRESSSQYAFRFSVRIQDLEGLLKLCERFIKRCTLLKGESTQNGELYTYEIKNKPRHPYRVRATVVHVKTKQRGHSEYFHLESIQAHAFKNIPKIEKHLIEAAADCFNKAFPNFSKDSAQFSDDYYRFIEEKKFDAARICLDNYKNKYPFPNIQNDAQSKHQQLNIDQASHLIEEGIIDRTNKKYGDARTKFTKAEHLDATNHQVVVELTNIYLAEGNWQLAIDKLKTIEHKHIGFQIQRAALEKCYDANLELNKAKQLVSQGKKVSAVDHYKKALQYLPNDFSIVIQLVYILEDTGQYVEAETMLAPYVPLHPEYQTYFEDLHAMVEFEKRIGTDALVARGGGASSQLYLEENSPSTQQELENTEEPKLEHIYEQTANTTDEPEFDKEQVAAIKVQLDKILQNYIAGERHVREGKQFEQEGNIKQAKKAYKQAAILNPNHALSLADFYERQSKYPKAISALDKLPSTPAIQEYKAFLGATWLEKRSTPFVNVLFQHINERIHEKKLPLVLDKGFRVLSAVHQINPQAPLALGMWLGAGPMGRQVWQTILFQNFAQEKVGLVHDGMLALNTLGLADYIPRYQTAETFLQEGRMIETGGRFLHAAYTKTLFNNNGLLMFIPVERASLFLYDKYILGKIAETTLQCVERDSYRILAKFLFYNHIMPPPLMPWYVGAEIINVASKIVLGSYTKEALKGSLFNARAHLLNNNTGEAWNRYQHLPAYQMEYQFSTAFANSPLDLSTFEFSIAGNEHSVSIKTANAIFTLHGSKERSITEFNHLLDTLMRMAKTEIPRQESGVGLYAKLSYAGEVVKLDLANTAEAQLERAKIELEEEESLFLAKRGCFSRISDWLIKSGCLTRFLGTEVSSDRFDEQKNALNSLLNQAQKNAEYLSLGTHDKQCHEASSYYESLMMKVLKYLYSEATATEIALPDIRDITRVVSLLLCIIKDSRSSSLEQLAYFILMQLKTTTLGAAQLHKLYSRSLQLSEILEQNPAVSELLGNLVNPFEKHNLPTTRPTPYSVLNCLYGLINGKLSDSQNNTLKAVLDDFMENIPAMANQEALSPESYFNSAHQFRYRIDAPSSQKSMLLSYLSGMLMFYYLIHKLTTARQVHDKANLLRNEILDRVLLSGYLPPFSMMMFRVMGSYAITVEQAREMLSWYRLDLDLIPAHTKLDMFLSLYAHRPDQSKPLGSLNHICSVWGDLVRRAIFQNRDHLTTGLLLGCSALSKQKEAFSEEDIAHIKARLSRGANPNATIEKIVLFDIAINMRSGVLVELLCQYGTHINKPNAYGLTPIQHAAIELSKNPKVAALKQIVIILCKYGADLRADNTLSFFSTPFWWLDHGGHSAQTILTPEIKKTFTEQELTLSAYDRNSFLREPVTPLESHQDSMLDLNELMSSWPRIPEFKVKIQVGEQLGWNCFDIAIGLSRKELVDFALAHKASPLFRNLLAPEIKMAAQTTATLMNQGSPMSSQQAEALPQNMHTKKVQNLFNDIHKQEEAMKPQLVICNDLLGFPEGKRHSFNELGDFFANNPPKNANVSLAEMVFNQAMGQYLLYEKALNDFCESEPIYEEYIKTYYAEEEWVSFLPNTAGSNNTSMVDIASICINKRIIIYRKDSQSSIYKEIYSTAFQGNGTVHIEHDINHFRALAYNSEYISKVENLVKLSFFNSNATPKETRPIKAPTIPYEEIPQLVMGYATSG